MLVPAIQSHARPESKSVDAAAVECEHKLGRALGHPEHEGEDAEPVVGGGGRAEDGTLHTEQSRHEACCHHTAHIEHADDEHELVGCVLQVVGECLENDGQRDEDCAEEEVLSLRQRHILHRVHRAVVQPHVGGVVLEDEHFHRGAEVEISRTEKSGNQSKRGTRYIGIR